MIRHHDAPPSPPFRFAGRIAIPLVACLAISVAGCQFIRDSGPRKLNPFAKDSKPETPDRMMVIWSDSVLHQPQKPGVRGFGGRVYFYGGEKPDPLVVDGGLVVYAFDGGDLSSDATRPEKKYVFTADQLPEHMSHTDMGASYSIWLPWDEIGGPNRKLSLVVRFEGRDGGVVISKPTMKLLPGVGKYVKATDGDGSVVHASGTAGSNDGASRVALTGHVGQPGDDASEREQPRRPSMTIDVPPSFHRHLLRDARNDAAPNRNVDDENARERDRSTPESGPTESNPRSGNTGSGNTGSGNAGSGNAGSGNAGSGNADDSVFGTSAADETRKRGHRGRPRQILRTNGTPDGASGPEPTRGIHRPAGWLTPGDKAASVQTR